MGFFNDVLNIANNYWKALIWWDGTEYSGLAISLWTLSLSIFIAFFIAIPFSIMRVSSNPFIRAPIWFFSYIFRGTPLYIQLLMIYSGLISLEFINNTPTLHDFFFSGFNCVILAFTLNTLAYTTEIFAGYIRSIPSGEVEAAKSYGMSKFQVYSRLIVPSALRRSLPAYSNEVVLMLHSTTLAFTATVPDLMKVTMDAMHDTYLTMATYTVAAIIYMIVSFIIVGIFRLVERRALAFLAYEKE